MYKTDNSMISVNNSRRSFLSQVGLAFGGLFLSPEKSICGNWDGHAATGAAGDEAIRPFIIKDNQVIIPAGTHKLGNREIYIKEKRMFTVPPPERVCVTGEELILSKKRPSGFSTGTRLKGPQTLSIGALNAFIEDSLILRDSQGKVLKVGDDYLVSAPHALLGLGTKPSFDVNETVYADYTYYLQRIDSISLDQGGNISYQRGESCLVSPPLPTGETSIGNIYVPFGSLKLSADHVFPVVASSHDVQTMTTSGRIPRTLRKLQLGEPVNIIAWGDSITVGADVKPEEAWANRLPKAIRNRFPNAGLTFQNYSIGGSKTAQWLNNGHYPGLPDKDPEKCRFEFVLNAKPDLVVMEFVNDVVFNESQLIATYDDIKQAFDALGTEWIIVVPSYRVSKTLSEMKDEQPRLLDRFLRNFAITNGYALADAAARWKHLYKEGIPYFSLFNNGYNHPNKFGHGLFIEEIMKCFD